MRLFFVSYGPPAVGGARAQKAKTCLEQVGQEDTVGFGSKPWELRVDALKLWNTPHLRLKARLNEVDDHEAEILYDMETNLEGRTGLFMRLLMARMPSLPVL